jgi:transcriptional regulator with XRE-family HTH domain
MVRGMESKGPEMPLHPLTRLEFIRRQARMDQPEFGHMIGYSARVVSQLETGVLSPSRVSPKLRKDIEKALDTVLEWVLAEVDGTEQWKIKRMWTGGVNAPVLL